MSKKVKSSNCTKKQENQEKRARQGKQVTIFAVIMGVLIIVGILAAIISQSGVIVNQASAITVDGKKYKLSEFNYYYYANYNSYMDENSQFIGYMFDQGESLKEQEYDEKQSWFDYFKDQTVESMTGVLRTAASAEKDGYKLSNAGQTEIDSVMKGINSSAKGAQISTDKYLENIYGKGMTEELYKKHLTNSHMASEYSEQVKADFTFGEKEIQDYYQEHLPEYTFVNYERFYVKASEVDVEPSKEEKEKADKIAQEIYERVQKGEELKSLGEEFKEKGTYYSFDDAYYDASFSYGEWLFAAERKDGDAKVIDDGSGYYVMVFHSRNESSYLTANIIDIQMPVDLTSEDSSAVDYNDKINQLYETSCTRAEEVLNKWNAGDKTEGSFETLASQYTESDDTDGTYQNLTRGVLDDAIDKWTFDSGRKAGDCQVLYTEGGFHVVYYAGTGEEAWKVQAEEDLRSAAYDSWYEELQDNAKAKRHEYVLNFAGDEINK